MKEGCNVGVFHSIDGDANIREEPGFSGKIIGVTKKGKAFIMIDTVTEVDGLKWYIISQEDNKIGWCADEAIGVYFTLTKADIEYSERG